MLASFFVSLYISRYQLGRCCDPLHVSIVFVSGFDLAPEYSEIDYRVEQQDWKDEQAFSPEHECKSRLGRCRILDGEGKGNDVRPERDRECAEGRDENQDDHGKGNVVVAEANAECKHQGRKRAYHRKDEQVRALEPSSYHAKIFG